jgi:hypothetical protein
MNQAKKVRIEQATHEAWERTQKHLHSLHHCLARSDVMRHHHDALVQEMTEADHPDAFNNVKKVRFMAYLSFWYTALSGVIERYEQLRDDGSIPADPDIDHLLTDDFKNIVKPFRNSVAHCSAYDDRRTLEIFEHEATVPDHAASLAQAFHSYFNTHKRAKA